MSKIRWIQLSDLHFGHDSPFCQKSRDALRDFILEHQKEIDYIFITGDIIYAADANTSAKRNRAYRDAEEYLKGICYSLWGSESDREIKKRVFIVPGNHDLVQNDLRTDSIKGLLKKYSAERDKIIDTSYLDNTRDVMKSFLTFYRRFASKENANNMQKKLHFVADAGQINVLHINTCISSSSSMVDSGNLIVGYDLINDALNSIQNNKPTIAIAHHNFEFLNRLEQKRLELALKEKNVCLYLCGHAHERESNLIVHYNQQKVLNTYTCGTLMAEDEGNGEIDTTVFLGELDVDSNAGRIRSFLWSLDSNWHYDADFGLIQDPQGTQGNCRYFDPNRFASGDVAKLLTDGAEGITAQIVNHRSDNRHRAFFDLNGRAKSSLSIYGIGITSVSQNTELFNKILSGGGTVQLCMVDPEVFKKNTCGGKERPPQICTLGKTKFCVYKEHINEYMRPAYYRSMKDSYRRLRKYQEEIAPTLSGKFKVKILRSFIPMSINIINEDTDYAELITEYNMPFQQKRLLLQLSKQENDSYYAQIKDIFDTIWRKAVDIKW